MFIYLAMYITVDSLQPHGLQPARLLHPWDFPGKNTGVGCHFLLQGIFPTQGQNPDLPHCRQIVYCLNHQGSLKRWRIMCSNKFETFCEKKSWTKTSLMLHCNSARELGDTCFPQLFDYRTLKKENMPQSSADVELKELIPRKASVLFIQLKLRLFSEFRFHVFFCQQVQPLKPSIKSILNDLSKHLLCES